MHRGGLADLHYHIRECRLSPCVAVALLHLWCSGPMYERRSAECPRSHGSELAIGFPQRAQTARPVATRPAYRSRNALCRLP
jgi:hypothetical protein